MAIVFMVVAECGDDEECAQSIVSHFMRVRWLLSDGTSMQFLSEPTHVWRRGNIFWCSVIPEGGQLDWGIHSELRAQKSGQRLQTEPMPNYEPWTASVSLWSVGRLLMNAIGKVF
jgi:hypothetical protein